MQASVKTSVLLRGKRFFLILGAGLLIGGLALIIVHSSSVIRLDRVFEESVSVTVTNGGWSSSNFQALDGDWIEFNFAATNRSVLQLRAVDLPLTQNSMVYNVEAIDENAALHGVNYKDTVLINVTSGYYAELDNWAGHYEDGPRGPNTVFVYDDNTFSGSFYLLRMPNYYPYLLTVGGALLAASCGLLLIPALAHLRLKGKQFGITS